jgi:hypothetical protein
VAPLDTMHLYESAAVAGLGPATLSLMPDAPRAVIVPHVVRPEPSCASIEETAARIVAGDGENGTSERQSAIATYRTTRCP